jgi:hypothetical protein
MSWAKTNCSGISSRARTGPGSWSSAATCAPSTHPMFGSRSSATTSHPPDHPQGQARRAMGRGQQHRDRLHADEFILAKPHRGAVHGAAVLRPRRHRGAMRTSARTTTSGRPAPAGRSPTTSASSAPSASKSPSAASPNQTLRAVRQPAPRPPDPYPTSPAGREPAPPALPRARLRSTFRVSPRYRSRGAVPA